MSNVDDIRKEAQSYPGCRLVGTFTKIMKVRSEIHINFRDHVAIYNVLKREKNPVNLNYKLESLTFGTLKAFNEITGDLSPYYPDIINELDPVRTDRSHLNGNFIVKHNLHVFPVEFKSDVTGELVDSYQYSIVKKFKAISQSSMEAPDITFQVEFLPLISLYHLKLRSMRKLIVNLLAVCGGVFSMMGLVNWFLSSGMRMLVGA
jgi:hypothetical protein